MLKFESSILVNRSSHRERELLLLRPMPWCLTNRKSLARHSTNFIHRKLPILRRNIVSIDILERDTFWEAERHEKTRSRRTKSPPLDRIPL